MQLCREVGQRVRSALLWVGMTGLVLGLILGIAYGEGVQNKECNKSLFCLLIVPCAYWNASLLCMKQG